MKLTETAQKTIKETLQQRAAAIAKASQPFDDNISSFVAGYAMAKAVDLSIHMFDLDKLEFVEKPKPAKEGATGGTDNN